jgi:hypothetical protein
MPVPGDGSTSASWQLFEHRASGYELWYETSRGGQFARWLAGKGFKVVGLERSPAMLRALRERSPEIPAALGIAVIDKEGAAGRALLAADVIVGSAADALDMPRYPQRLVATLRTA